MTNANMSFLSFGCGRDKECSDYADKRKANDTNHFKFESVMKHKNNANER